MWRLQVTDLKTDGLLKRDQRGKLLGKELNVKRESATISNRVYIIVTDKRIGWNSRMRSNLEFSYFLSNLTASKKFNDGLQYHLLMYTGGVKLQS